MTHSPEVVVIGSLNMDFFFHTPRIPAAGETLLGGKFITAPGGKGANQAVGLAKLGRDVAMVGRVGEDPFGQTLIDGLKEQGVDISHIQRDPESATGVALILLEQNGQNRIIVASGANQRLQPEHLSVVEPLIAGAQVLVMQLETPLETVMRAATIAKEAGIQVVLNPAPGKPLPSELLRQVDILIPNEVEAAMLVGASEGADLHAIAKQLLQEGAKIVLITLGGAGALFVNDEGSKRMPPFDVEVVDTTAAGDAFVAGFVAALTEGKSMHEAVRWGNAAGALACTRIGAQPALPSREQFMYLLGR
jgi:ribokinase